jgi:hypothetical protein
VTLSARQENARTLASVLGLDEEEAGRLLDVAITIHVSEDANAKSVRGHVVEMLRRMISGIDESDSGTVGIHIGSVPLESRAPVVHVGVTNAEIVISTAPVPEHDPAAEIPEIALLLTACYAAAMAVRIAIGPNFSLPSQDIIRLPLDALLRNTRGEAQRPIPIGKVYLAGAGAIGNAFLWGLSTFRVQGELCIVDPKTVSPGNLGR